MSDVTITIEPDLEERMKAALVEANEQRHQFITVEHLLLAILDNPSVAEVLRARSVYAEDLRRSLSSNIAENTQAVAGCVEVDTDFAPSFRRVIERAIKQVLGTRGKKEVTGAHVLYGIYGEKDSHSVSLLHQQGLMRYDVRRFI